jgi:hypothetical protein
MWEWTYLFYPEDDFIYMNDAGSVLKDMFF